MRSMRVHELSDDIGVLRMDEVALPPPGPGQLRLDLKACSVNFPDILMVQGKYQFKPELPFAPGMEGAGVVAETGEGVTMFKRGDRVMAGLRTGGTSPRPPATRSPALWILPRPPPIPPPI